MDGWQTEDEQGYSSSSLLADETLKRVSERDDLFLAQRDMMRSEKIRWLFSNASRGMTELFFFSFLSRGREDVGIFFLLSHSPTGIGN